MSIADSSHYSFFFYPKSFKLLGIMAIRSVQCHFDNIDMLIMIILLLSIFIASRATYVNWIDERISKFNIAYDKIFPKKSYPLIMHFKRAPCVDCHASAQVAGVCFACMLFIVNGEDVHVTQYLTGENVGF